MLDHVPYQSSCRREDGAFFNGAIHWVIRTELDHPPLPIVSFHLGTNTFVEIPVPEIDMYLYCFMNVGALDGCLCIMLNYLFDHEIWVMKEYGVVESWTKLYRVEKVRESGSIERPVAFSENGKELLVRLSLFWITSIDLENLVIEDVKAFNNPSKRVDAHVCVENLLMLDSLSDIVESQEQEQQNITKRRRHRRKGRRRRRRRRN